MSFVDKINSWLGIDSAYERGKRFGYEVSMQELGQWIDYNMHFDGRDDFCKGMIDTYNARFEEETKVDGREEQGLIKQR